jgi:hypothetical protein
MGESGGFRVKRQLTVLNVRRNKEFNRTSIRIKVCLLKLRVHSIAA